MSKQIEYNKAVQLGILCIFSYLASYCMRNILSVSTPSMLHNGEYTKEFIGLLSSAYFLIYAVGQLANGVVGDTVKPKIMTFIGLIVSGLISIFFPFIKVRLLQIVVYAIMGFSLSMLRGPLVKTISENTLPKYARVVCVFFSFSSFAGPLLASILAMFFDWKMTFVSAGIINVIIGICSYVFFTVMEKKKIINYKESTSSVVYKNVFKIFKLDKFFFYMIVGALVEISITSISFWIPTYMSERLGFSDNISNLMFSAITFVKAVTPFLALIIYKLFKENDIKMIRFAFLLAAVFFIALLFITNKYINVIIFTLALMAVGSASTLLWSVYIPSQGKSGMVSTLNGFLDFSGYVCVCVANIVFSIAMTRIGWNSVIVIWISLMIFGFIISFFEKNKCADNNIQ